MLFYFGKTIAKDTILNYEKKRIKVFSIQKIKIRGIVFFIFIQFATKHFYEEKKTVTKIFLQANFQNSAYNIIHALYFFTKKSSLTLKVLGDHIFFPLDDNIT